MLKLRFYPQYNHFYHLKVYYLSADEWSHLYVKTCERKLLFIIKSCTNNEENKQTIYLWQKNFNS